LAERLGFFPQALRNPNKGRHFHSKSKDASILALADSFARFRLFASVFEFWQRNVTRSVTRRERLAQSPVQGTPSSVNPWRLLMTDPDWNVTVPSGATSIGCCTNGFFSSSFMFFGGII
jgi:hypothetical protein